ncbi:C10 family peptidase [Porphyromonas endodontalis]|uniref:C10 family peptidase n=2 Tax=Porphyromonas endodontalis TaxID=28124 RepID=UPI0028E5B39A|nr:C10 family peptidase [Porphyromonas endodontalis]
MKRIILFCIAIIAMLSSCNNNHYVLDPQLKEDSSSVYMDNLWTPEEAAQNVRDFILGISENGSLRNVSLNIESVIPISSSLREGGAKLRDGNLSDTTLYLINFVDNGGYAIAAADKHVSPVVAYVPEGHLVGLDDIDNPGFEMYVNRAVSYIRKEVEEQKWVDKIVGINASINPNDIYQLVIYQSYGSWNQYVLDRFLTTIWHQNPPFNDNAPVKGGVKAPAGCVAIALGQIFSYYENPIQYDWTCINKFANSTYTPSTQEEEEAKPLIAKLLRDIGEGVHMDYGSSGSGASSDNALAYMRSLNFSCENLQDYSVSKIKESILNGYPVYIEGFRYKDEVNKTGYTGHAWVIDGVGVRRRRVQCYHLGKLVARFFETDNIVACNWGWGEGWNGYFLADVLTPGDAISFDKGADDDKPVQKGRYHLNVRIIPNIKH